MIVLQMILLGISFIRFLYFEHMISLFIVFLFLVDVERTQSFI